MNCKSCPTAGGVTHQSGHVTTFSFHRVEETLLFYIRENGSLLPAAYRRKAWQLFGSAKATGRCVEIRGRIYYVAGIEYREKELCAYSLVPDGKEEITGFAVHMENREQMEMDVRKAERRLGVEISK